MFKEEAYSAADIAQVLGKSDNYVYGKMKAANILPEGERITAMGPNTKVWKKTTLNRLWKEGGLSNSKVGDVVWFDSLSNKEVEAMPTQVYLVKAYLMDNNQRIPIYKVGLTNKKDVIKTRFKEEVTTGLLQDVNLLANYWCKNRLEAEQLEQHLFQLVVDKFGGYKMADGTGEVRFHNFWTKDMPKGITEMRKLNVKETNFLIEYFKNLSSE